MDVSCGAGPSRSLGAKPIIGELSVSCGPGFPMPGTSGSDGVDCCGAGASGPPGAGAGGTIGESGNPGIVGSCDPPADPLTVCPCPAGATLEPAFPPRPVDCPVFPRD